ncbi:hypothetical protein ES708_27637 [subsurface metagenome]
MFFFAVFLFLFGSAIKSPGNTKTRNIPDLKLTETRLHRGSRCGYGLAQESTVFCLWSSGIRTAVSRRASIVVIHSESWYRDILQLCKTIITAWTYSIPRRQGCYRPLHPGTIESTNVRTFLYIVESSSFSPCELSTRLSTILLSDSK